MPEIGEYQTSRETLVKEASFYRKAKAPARPGSDQYYLKEDDTRANHIEAHLNDIKDALFARGYNAENINTFEDVLPLLCEIPSKPNTVVEEDPGREGQLFYDPETGILVIIRFEPTDFDIKREIKVPPPYIVTAYGANNDRSAMNRLNRRAGGRLQ